MSMFSYTFASKLFQMTYSTLTTVPIEYIKDSATDVPVWHLFFQLLLLVI